MSLSTHVIGFVPPDERWKAMKAIWDACKKAKIDPPTEVEDFFEGRPDEEGQEVVIPHKQWVGEDSNGIEINTAKIPAKVKIIRFYILF